MLTTQIQVKRAQFNMYTFHYNAQLVNTPNSIYYYDV